MLIRELSTASPEEIVIPARKERGPTEILKAISATVGTDFTGPHFRYHDDPWLIPYTQNNKRDYLLAKESGRDAARFILEKHPLLFEKNRITAEPPITAFQPRAKYNKDNITVELLENLISSFQMEDAVQVYELLVQKNKDVPVELQQSLLELLAFHSSAEPLTPDNRDIHHFLPVKAVWQNGGLAGKLYSALATPQARLAMLLGLARFDNITRTMQIWDEIRTNKDDVPLEAYNAVLATISIEQVPKLKTEIVGILTQIRDAGLVPDEVTLVACLKAIAKTGRLLTGNYAGCTELALSVMSEFKQMGVEPSLGAYYLLLEIFYVKSTRERTMLLKDILHQLQDRDMWPAKTLEDFRFFRRAMQVSRFLNLPDLAYRLHNLLLTGNNINLVGNFLDSEAYYDLFMDLLLEQQDLDTVLRMFRKFSPHQWSPKRGFFDKLLMEIHSKGAVQHLGMVFDKMDLMNYGGSSKMGIYELNTLVLECMTANPTETTDLNNISSTYVDIAQRIFDNLQQNKDSSVLRLHVNTMAAGICTQSANILLKEGQVESALKIFEFCAEEKERMPGQLSNEVLRSLLDAAIEVENLNIGLKMVDYMISMNSPFALSSGQKLASSSSLTNYQRDTLNKYFAHDQNWVNV